MVKFYIKTYGCQMNEYDSEYISSVLISKGYYETFNCEEADYIILNTCSVREKAEEKVYSEIGRIKKLKRRDKEIKLGICGCVAQQQGYNIMERFKDVSFVVGTDALNRFERILNRVELGERIIDTDFKSNKLIKGKFKREQGTIAYVSIMKGCNNYCSYCIVPYVRGREISREPEEILDEIKYLVDLGYKEVILLGQNVNSYGKTLDETINFPKFLSMVNNINGLERIRFVTSHPKDFDEDLILAMHDNEKVCEQIHLPIQSGSNKILKSMNRKYTSQEYLKKIEKLRKYIPEISISSDFIVGFPGESEEDFNDTLNLLNEVKYNNIFAFKYSVRHGTKAASFDDNVPLDIKKKRLDKLINIQCEITYKINKSYEGKVLEVLVEGKSKKDERAYMGRSRQNQVVNFYSDKNIRKGDLVMVSITEGKKNSLFGYIY